MEACTGDGLHWDPVRPLHGQERQGQSVSLQLHLLQVSISLFYIECIKIKAVFESSSEENCSFCLNLTFGDVNVCVFRIDR
jgi:hypothetical protein